MLSLLFLPLEMNICNKPSNKTAPEKNVWTAPAQASGPSPELQGQRSRRNGWSWPPHPLQIVAWLLYLFFAVIGFGVLVPLLPQESMAFIVPTFIVGSKPLKYIVPRKA